MLTRDEMIDVLKKNNCVVMFTKVNGEIRVMPCTLKESELPTVELTEKSKKPNLDVVSVWCTDKKEWRSFRVDSVKQFIIN